MKRRRKKNYFFMVQILEHIRNVLEHVQNKKIMRAFIGVDIPPEIASRYTELCTPFRDSCRATYERPEKMHITLAFFQNLSPENLAKVDSILHEVKSDFINVDIDGFGSFDRRGIPSVLLVKIISETLIEYGNQIRRKLMIERIPYDTKPLNPHLTLARVKYVENRAKFQQTYNDVSERCQKSSFQAKTVHLYESLDGEYIKRISVDFEPTP